ncbi:MAG: chemotaxis protein CheA [Rhizobiales bacterium]|nr:chemotaxis protein CheA [Hyphomicrobiales bacterium]
MDPLAAIKATYFQECDEQLAELETGLSAMKDGEGDDETVNAVFRAAHSIKGGAGAFGLENLVQFAHVLETTLDDVRAGRLAPDGDLVNLMLRASDMLSDHVNAARDGNPVDQARSETIARELENYNEATKSGSAESDDEFDIDFAPIAVTMSEGDAAAEAAALGVREWEIQFRPRTSLYAHANEVTLLLRELQRLGTLSVDLIYGDLPSLQDLVPEESYLAWIIRLQADCDESRIREVFEFVEDDCDIHIQCISTCAGEIEVSHAQPEPKEVIVPQVPGISTAQADEPAPAKATMPMPLPANSANAPAEEEKHAPAVVSPQTIRVDVDRLERLVDLVGELVINQAMLAQRSMESGLSRASSFANGLEDLEHLTRDIQDSVMSIRAQPVKSVFQRMTRLVREVSAATGKRVRLVTDGENTEVDKTVIERIADPITHLLRNAIDHGIEKPDIRIAAGKPAEGVVRLSALHRSGRIVIEVVDDGAGIDRKRVKAIAVEKNLISADVNLSDEEIDNLIFMPGFSTASSVSEVSGRGVGMDVVRRNIQSLGGRITISSRPGLGSTFSLSLPLTLAVLDGMVISVCNQTLVIPLSAVVETLRPKEGDLHELKGSAPLIRIRDLYVPIIDVGRKLGHRTEPLVPAAGVALFVESEGGGRAALLVDAIQGQRQVVIKSMEANYRKVDGIAAATILGDGRVALIVDVESMLAGQSVDMFRSEKRAAAG